ncbi:hypothetical protein ARMGADRAFT_1030324 [Armillaria gallica]|uniref:Uncharacterized protein n=1 Tax=Armillaria gallica TaxID=47427 RepID=A0A2H3DPM5_ARMGA|nr:hypothetical protein ARMGADRAFT_1030324 [Armillaria gallica]
MTSESKYLALVSSIATIYYDNVPEKETNQRFYTRTALYDGTKHLASPIRPCPHGYSVNRDTKSLGNDDQKNAKNDDHWSMRKHYKRRSAQSSIDNWSIGASRLSSNGRGVQDREHFRVREVEEAQMPPKRANYEEFSNQSGYLVDQVVFKRRDLETYRGQQ